MFNSTVMKIDQDQGFARGAKLEAPGCSARPSAELAVMIAARRLRASFFAKDLFADPAWDILLELYASELDQHRVSVTDLCSSAGVPASTRTRWIGKLEQEGLLRRRIDRLDSRRTWVELTPSASQAMAAYLAACRGHSAF